MSGLAERLRSVRLRACLTQHELAAVARVSRDTIAKTELAGGDIYPSTARKLAEALSRQLGQRVDPGWLLTGEGPGPSADLELERSLRLREGPSQRLNGRPPGW